MIFNHFKWDFNKIKWKILGFLDQFKMLYRFPTFGYFIQFENEILSISWYQFDPKIWSMISKSRIYQLKELNGKPNGFLSVWMWSTDSRSVLGQKWPGTTILCTEWLPVSNDAPTTQEFYAVCDRKCCLCILLSVLVSKTKFNPGNN